MRVAASAPPKAIRGTVSRPRKRPVCRSAAMAPKAPPEEMPRRWGSASGLRVTDCRAAPVIPRPAPTSAARRARGKRMSQTIASRPDVQSGVIRPGIRWLASTPQTVARGTATAPTDTATRIERRRAPPPPSARPARRVRRRAGVRGVAKGVSVMSDFCREARRSTSCASRDARQTLRNRRVCRTVLRAMSNRRVAAKSGEAMR